MTLLQALDSNGNPVYLRVDNNGKIISTNLQQTTGDITESELDNNNYTFDPTVDAIELLNTGTTDLNITIQSKSFIIIPDERRILTLASKIGLVAFSDGAVFRMNGLNRG